MTLGLTKRIGLCDEQVGKWRAEPSR